MLPPKRLTAEDKSLASTWPGGGGRSWERRELWHERERQRHGTAEGFSRDVQSADADVALARRMIMIQDIGGTWGESGKRCEKVEENQRQSWGSDV